MTTTTNPAHAVIDWHANATRHLRHVTNARTNNDAATLLTMWAAGGTLTMTEISDNAFLSKAAVTALVDRLEALGLVKRAPHRSDRRITTVTLTAKATRALGSIPTWRTA